MRKTLIVIVFIFFTTLLVAQDFDIKNINQTRLEQLVLQKLNDHRKGLQLPPLSPNLILQKAAAIHSKYQVENNILTHDEKIENLATPFKRVLSVGGTNGLVGENVAYVSAKKTYEELATSFYQSWKNSPPHYKNMIHPDYRYSGIRFQLSQDERTVFGTHVFGGVIYVPPSSVSIPLNAFGIQKYDEKKCKDMVDNVLSNYEISVSSYHIFNDSLFIEFSDINYIRKTLLKESDGFAVDIIERRQLPCGDYNMFHGSIIHDGVMLKPIFKKEIFKYNHSSDTSRIRIFLGMIPKGLDSEFDLNLIKISSGCVCFQTNMLNVPSNKLPLFHIDPIWAFAEMKERGIVDTISPIVITSDRTETRATISYQEEIKSFPISFEKNKYHFQNSIKTLQDFLEKNKTQISEIKIQAYSSIEGTLERNIFLQKKRAELIENEIEKIGFSNLLTEVKSEENWNLFYQQIVNTEWSNWTNESKSNVKTYLRNQTIEKKIEPFLNQQRVANVIVRFNAEIKKETYYTSYFDDVKTDENVKTLLNKFSRLVAKNKIDSALLVQYELIQKFLDRKISILDIVNQNIPIVKENLPLLSNQLAVELFFQSNVRKDTAFINRVNQMVQLDTDYLPMRFNLYGYAVRYLFDTKDTLINPIDLEFEIEYLLNDEEYKITYLNNPIKTIERLQVNYHLAASRYYHKMRYYDLSNESLEFIKDYFINQGLTELESLQLALFFNWNSKFEWTLDLLYPILEKGNYLENTLFTYVETSPIYMENGSEYRSRFLKYGRIAMERNPTRFCNWVNYEFQLLRHKEVKELYCFTCEK